MISGRGLLFDYTYSSLVQQFPHAAILGCSYEMMGHVFVSLVCLFVVSVSLPVNEEKALQDIFRAAQIPLATGDPCEIETFIYLNGYKVSCHNNHVTKLTMNANQLTSLPESIGQLQQLSDLNLQFNQLTSLPESIGQLQQLSHLDLQSNQLTSLPESIGQLQQLSHLDLQSNQLTSLPESIGQLQQLSHLYIGRNKLTSLPESFGHLQELQTLDLGFNRLTSLSWSLGNLQKLYSLYLENNQLTSLPETLGHLQQLRDLFLASNQLTAIPEPLCKLQKLANLNLDSNQLTSLPETLSNLQGLEGLDLSFNQLTKLPDTLSNLQQLGSLKVTSNQLIALPDSFWQLQRLSTLLLADNQLTSLPEGIGQLQQLKILDVTSNQLTSLSESFGQLQGLVGLRLGFNQLTSLPDPLCDLQQLGTLVLRSNQLTSLPDCIHHLEQLDTLDLSSNQLTSLPESVGQLQLLMELDLSYNQLTSLPESFAKLKRLVRLNLDNNQLTSLPESFGQLQRLSELYLKSNLLGRLLDLFGELQGLWSLDLSSNRITELPESFGKLERLFFLDLSFNYLKMLPEAAISWTRLRDLSVHHNQLDQLPESCTSLTGLKSVLLHSNKLQASTEVCKFQNALELNTLYMHDNRMTGNIPACLDAFQSLETLTLHNNRLVDSLNPALAQMPHLKVLTLHKNRLGGRIPENFRDAPKLTFLSLHGNDFEGHIPTFELGKGCVDDQSFLYDRLSCGTLGQRQSVFCDKPDVARHCPHSCGLCSTASARGPLLLLHDNRLSCSLPDRVTQWPQDLRSIVLIGNVLGNGTPDLPSWIEDSERNQTFLYISYSKTQHVLNQALPSAGVFLFCCILFFVVAGHRHLFWTNEDANWACEEHKFLLRMAGILSLMAAILCVFYRLGATYYACGDPFSKTTLSHFANPGHENALLEWAVAIVWALWVAVAVVCLGQAPASRSREFFPSHSWTCWSSWTLHARKGIYSLGWALIVAILSLPSIFYATLNALPSNNTLAVHGWWPKFLHYQTAFLMVLVDTSITPKVVERFALATGIRRSMLLMAARLGTMWLVAVLVTLYLSTHCMNGWTHFWKVCEESTGDYRAFNISIGDHHIFEPKADLCTSRESWWSYSACVRSVVDTMAPLLVSKMIARAFLQPVFTLVTWQISKYEDGQLYISCSPFASRWRICSRFKEWRICTSKSLEHGQQASLLVTFAEVEGGGTGDVDWTVEMECRS